MDAALNNQPKQNQSKMQYDYLYARTAVYNMSTKKAHPKFETQRWHPFCASRPPHLGGRAGPSVRQVVPLGPKGVASSLYFGNGDADREVMVQQTPRRLQTCLATP